MSLSWIYVHRIYTVLIPAYLEELVEVLIANNVIPVVVKKFGEEKSHLVSLY